MSLAPPILLLSPDGMLGRAFALVLRKRGLDFAAATFPDFNLTDSDSIARLMRPGVRTVINCAAYTDVDGAESNEAEASAINRDGVGMLAAHCKTIDAKLVHFSTDYVFDGRGTSPYPVDATAFPINAYGRSKAQGETAIELSGCEHLLVRTSWLYAPWGKNFVLTMSELGRQQSSVRVVTDQVGRPTSAKYLAERTLALLDRKATGIFHVTDGGSCTWHALAVAVMKANGSRCVVEKCTSSEYPRPALRPAYGVLDISATDALLGPSRDWKENVSAVLAEYRISRGM